MLGNFQRCHSLPPLSTCTWACLCGYSPVWWEVCPLHTPHCRGFPSCSWHHEQTPERAAWGCSRAEHRAGGSAGARPARSGPPWAPPQSVLVSGYPSRTQSPGAWPSQPTSLATQQTLHRLRKGSPCVKYTLPDFVVAPSSSTKSTYFLQEACQFFWNYSLCWISKNDRGNLEMREANYKIGECFVKCATFDY